MPLFLRFAFCIALTALAPTVAAADTITVSFTGSVSSVPSELASAFTVGDPVSGSFQYSSNLTDVLPGDPVTGVYLGATNFDFRFGGYVATAVAPGSSAQVENDATGTGLFDRFIGSKTCNGTCTGAAIGAFTLQGITLILSGPSTIFTDDSLPTSLDLTPFTQRSALLEFSSGSGTRGPRALLDSLTLTVTVPEPGALALLALGVLPLLRRRGR